MKRGATTSVPVFRRRLGNQLRLELVHPLCHERLKPYLARSISSSTLSTRLFFWPRFATVAYGIEMPRWVLICAQCKTEFEHSQVGDTGMFRLELPVKPDVPTGATCVCPACGYSTSYLRTDLLYRSRAASR
jgi:hypothetical protein